MELKYVSNGSRCRKINRASGNISRIQGIREVCGGDLKTNLEKSAQIIFGNCIENTELFSKYGIHIEHK